MGSIRNISVGLPVKDGHDHTEFVPKNKAKKYKTDRWCFDRVVFLKDKKTGKTITQQRIFTILAGGEDYHQLPEEPDMYLEDCELTW